MNKSQKRGVIFFSILALIIIGFQIYGYFIKGNAFDFEMIVMSLSLVVFCYFYPLKAKS